MASISLSSELEGSAFPENPIDINTRFNESINCNAQNLALICTHQPSNLYGTTSIPLNTDDYRKQPYLRWTYACLNRSINRLAAALAGGVPRGTPFFTFSGNTAEYVIATWAAYRLGCVHVPLNPRSLSNANEVKHMIRTVLEALKSQHMVVIANSYDMLEQIDEVLGDWDCFKICVEGPRDEWISFAKLMESEEGREGSLRKLNNVQASDTTVLFTSGTTSLPKGCIIRGTSWITCLESRHSTGASVAGDRVAVVVPNNHAINYIYLMSTLTHGAAVVFPGPSFTAEETWSTIQREKCTHTAMVSTMVHALISLKATNGKNLKSLKGVMLAGMPVTPAIVAKCREDLGASTVENMYGMTEGVLTFTGHMENLEDLSREGHIAVGKPAGGSKIRICAPGEDTPLPRNVPGHLHFSGPQLIKGYVGLETDDFYDDNEGRRWFITGDQGLVDDNGQLYVMGRYKEIIIRGGENISPAAIEDVLTQIPEYNSLHPQIIGISDSIAGEVPIAIVNQTIDSKLANGIKSTIRSKMGIIYVPNEVLSIQELGLDDFPKTLSGKVQKAKLTTIASKYLAERDGDSANGSSDFPVLEGMIRNIWGRVIGVDAKELDIKAPISDFADSILVIQARHRIKKETGMSIPLSTWNTASTISEQIELLTKATPSDQPNGHKKSSSITTIPELPQHVGGPTVEDMVHVSGNPSQFYATKDFIKKIIAPYQLGWEDVEDVMPTTDFVQAIARTQQINTWNIRTSIVSKNATSQQLRAALETTMAAHPLMLSFLATDDAALGPGVGVYVTIRQTKKILDQCIVDHDTVRTLEDLKRLVMRYPYKNHAMLPGPLFRAIIVYVEETKSAAVITNSSHAVVDKTYHDMFTEDLDCVLSGKPLTPRIPFKVWVDSYHSLRNSPAAKAAVNYHCNYLRTFHKKQHALWPRSTPTLTFAPDREFIDGHIVLFPAPGIVSLCRQYPELTPSAIVKAASALLIMHHTKQSHALFANLEAQRASFPFLPSSASAIGGFDPSDVAGPTFSAIIDLIALHADETVLQFLRRVQEEQTQLSRLAGVPWHEVDAQLGPNASGLSAEDLLLQAVDTFLFNWMPGLGAVAGGKNPYSNLTVAQTHIRTRMGMLMSAGMGGADGSQVVLLLHGGLSNMSTKGITVVGEELKRIILWLVEPGAWEKWVGSFGACLPRTTAAGVVGGVGGASHARGMSQDSGIWVGSPAGYDGNGNAVGGGGGGGYVGNGGGGGYVGNGNSYLPNGMNGNGNGYANGYGYVNGSGSGSGSGGYDDGYSSISPPITPVVRKRDSYPPLVDRYPVFK